MRALLVLCVLCAGLAGCKRQPGAAAPPAAESPAAKGAKGAAGPQWTEAKVKAYLKLQTELISALRQGPPADAGPGRPAHPTEEELAQVEAKLRKASGLTDEEVATLNTLATALITGEVMRTMAELGSMKNELAEARQGLPDGSVPEVDEALAAIARRQQRDQAMAEERAQFGDALVDAALPHRAALMENWSKLMDAAGEVGEAREEGAKR